VSDKSKDLAPDRLRCQDYDCPSWPSDCARAEAWTGQGRFTWLPLCTRRAKARKCHMRIDPVTLEEGK
jgi:hypothetical protein